MYFQNVYCGHEYTTANLKFGLHVEPENEDIIRSLKQAQELRTKSPPEPTVPSTIGKDQVIHFKSVIGEKLNQLQCSPPVEFEYFLLCFGR